MTVVRTWRAELEPHLAAVADNSVGVRLVQSKSVCILANADEGEENVSNIHTRRYLDVEDLGDTDPDDVVVIGTYLEECTFLKRYDLHQVSLKKEAFADLERVRVLKEAIDAMEAATGHEVTVYFPDEISVSIWNSLET